MGARGASATPRAQRAMRPIEAYDELVRRAREEAILGSCASLLEWDEETYMPPGGVENRSRQLALLAGLLHERAVEPRWAELLEAVEGSELVADPESAAAVNVRELRREHDREAKLPRRLVEESARVIAIAQQEWIAARAERRFERFRPWLERILALTREEAEHVGYEGELYDALLDLHEPGATARSIAALYEALRGELAPLAGAIARAAPARSPAIALPELAPDRQRALGEAAAAEIGFDFERGRLDASAHPFCTSIGPGDCRITTRLGSRDPFRGVLTVLHEAGHGLYEQGLDPEHYGTPMGEQASVGMDEAQARLWESSIGRSRAFWRHFLPLARKLLPRSFHGLSLDDVHRAVNRVAPGPIRAGADEVTYNLHALVRFELERALVNGALPPADVPEAWNLGYAHHLGVEPRDDAEGCLQDGHWADGLFGYFPTYTLGDVFRAQLCRKAGEDLGDLDERLGRGDFAVLVEWLRDNVHRHGSRHSSSRLIEVVTGAPPDHRPFIESLRAKYHALYGI